jgi:polysaccharide biosynthesis protein PelA
MVNFSLRHYPFRMSRENAQHKEMFHMKKIFFLLVTLTTLLNSAHANTTCSENPLYCNWLVYFNQQGNTGDFNGYNPIVFDADRHPDLKPLKPVKTVLGYISLGEVNVQRSYFDSVQTAGILIAPNPNYPGSWYVDLRNPFWKELIIQTVIPSILNQGFTGLFLDNLDIPIYLEQVNSNGYTGMIRAAADLIIAIRAAYPNIPLMMNRGYQLLSAVGGSITYALGESVLTRFNSTTERYEYVPIREYQKQVAYLQNAQSLYPKLILGSLDFWYPNDSLTISKIYHAERQNGFVPYVGAANLQQIVPEP